MGKLSHAEAEPGLRLQRAEPRVELACKEEAAEQALTHQENSLNSQKGGFTNTIWGL